MIKKIQNHSLDAGRSMVEILGVLAIIAILSIGALAAFSYGMAKARANNILNDIKYLAQELNGPQPPTIPATLKSLSDDYEAVIQNDSVVIYSNTVNNRTCDILLEQKLDYVAYITTKDNASCDDAEVQVAFYMEYPKTCTTNADCKQECATCLAGLCKVGTNDENNECVECMTNRDCPQGYWCRKDGPRTDVKDADGKHIEYVFNTQKRCVAISGSFIDTGFDALYSNSAMTYQDAQNLCDALNRTMPSSADASYWGNVWYKSFFLTNHHSYVAEKNVPYQTQGISEWGNALCIRDDSECTEPLVPSTDNDMCVQCNTDSDCLQNYADQNKKYCYRHLCVQCLTNAHCESGGVCSTPSSEYDACRPNISTNGQQGVYVAANICIYPSTVKLNLVGEFNGKKLYTPAKAYNTYFHIQAVCQANGMHIPTLAEYTNGASTVADLDDEHSYGVAGGKHNGPQWTITCPEGAMCQRQTNCVLADSPATVHSAAQPDQVGTICKMLNASSTYDQELKKTTAWYVMMFEKNHTGGSHPTRLCCVED